MKKFLLLLAVVFALNSRAAETVVIYYGFSPADSLASYGRSLAEEANRIQTRYVFLFDTKPGAGNAIAANYVKNTTNTILMTTSAFFVRPNFYPNESYDLNDFRELLPQCETPFAISSTQYRSWSEVPRNQSLNVGISGLGVTTHLITLQIMSRFPNLQPIPFKSTNDSVVSLLGGNIDFHLGFLSESETWATDSATTKIHILGITGSQIINHHSTLISQGFPSMLGAMSAPVHLVVPRTVLDSKFQDWKNILSQATHADSVRKAYQVDHCQPINDMTDAELNLWYTTQIEKWRKLSSGVRVN